MSKFIIRNESVLPDHEAFYYVMRVVEGGRISDNGESYCFATKFYKNINKDPACNVFAVKNKNSDTFIVRDAK